MTPDSASTLANLASAYFARKQYELASEYITKAVAIDPGILEHRNGVGNTVRDQSVGDRPTYFYYLAKTFAKAGVVLDAVPTPNEIDRALARLEGMARETGIAVGVATALPVSIARIANWAKNAEARGFLLVPISAAAVKPKSS